MAIARSRIGAFLLGILVLILDIVSKFLVVSYIPPMYLSPPKYPYGGIGIFKNLLGVDFSIVHTTNKGAAWGMFADYQEPLLWLRIVLIVALLIYFLFFQSARRLSLPLSLVIAGAIGNVIDYFIYGEVIDLFFFNLWGYHFPVFNVADSAISIGIIWLTLLNLRTYKTTHTPTP